MQKRCYYSQPVRASVNGKIAWHYSDGTTIKNKGKNESNS